MEFECVEIRISDEPNALDWRAVREVRNETCDVASGTKRIMITGSSIHPARVAGVILLAMVLGACGASAPKKEKPKPPAAAAGDPQGAQLAYYHFSDGTMLMQGGQYEDAAGEFERALQLDPGSYEIRMSLAECYFQLRQFDRAASIVQGATPQDERALDFLGQCYRYLGREDDAVTVYQRLVTLDSTNADAWWYLSRLAVRQAQFTLAVRDLSRLAALRPGNRVFNEIGDLNNRMGQFDEAIAAYRESLRLDSTADNREAWFGLAAALEPLGRTAQADSAYRSAIALAPDDLVARKRLMHLYLFTGQTDSAISVIGQILAIQPNDPERLRLGILWYETQQPAKAESLFTALRDSANQYIPILYLGRLAADRNDYMTAKADFRRAIAISDSVPDGWIQLGYALLGQDSLDAAVTTAHQAIRKTGQTKFFWYFIGLAFGRQNHHDSATVWLDRAWQADTTDTRVQFSLAASLERSGHFQRAADLFTDLIRREPDNATALNYLGYMYADSGIHLDQSLDLIRRALKKDSTNGAYLDSFAWALYRLHRYSEAEAQIRKALGVLQSDATVHDHCGDILAAQGRREEAQDQWRKALELDPNNQPIKQKLGL